MEEPITKDRKDEFEFIVSMSRLAGEARKRGLEEVAESIEAASRRMISRFIDFQ